ncbi:hypothetical protein LTR85_008251 [Meristemomyces frigidus]|nr:hypothetical protein LTR85_008251 [Meristemomyces frigidus]
MSLANYLPLLIRIPKNFLYSYSILSQIKNCPTTVPKMFCGRINRDPIEVPDDGSAPFYTYSTEDPDYDSDDAYDSLGRKELEVVERRFILPTYAPPLVPGLGRRGFLVKDGDVEISLSADEADTIIIASRVLQESREVWRIGLGPRWVHDKTTSTGMKRYEMEFTSPSESLLVGKTSPTSEDLRKKRITEIGQRFSGCGDYGRYYDEDTLRTVTVYFGEYVSATVAAYRIGLSMLRGLPPKMWRSRHEVTRRDVSPILVVLSLVDFVNACSSFSQLAARLDDFIHSKKVFHTVKTYPLTYLRIATLLRSSQLFKDAMVEAVQVYGRMISHPDPHVESNGPEEKLVANLGKDYRIATLVMGEHRRIEYHRQKVESDLDYLQTDNRQFPDALNVLAVHVFQEWWSFIKNAGRYYDDRSLYETLAAKKVDVSNIIGHWKARNTQYNSQLPRKRTVQDLEVSLQEHLDAAAIVVKQLYEDEGRLFANNLSPRNVCVGHYVYPWQEGMPSFVGRYSNLSQVSDEVTSRDNEEPFAGRM